MIPIQLIVEFLVLSLVITRRYQVLQIHVCPYIVLSLLNKLKIIRDSTYHAQLGINKLGGGDKIKFANSMKQQYMNDMVNPIRYNRKCNQCF